MNCVFICQSVGKHDSILPDAACFFSTCLRQVITLACPHLKIIQSYSKMKMNDNIYLCIYLFMYLFINYFFLYIHNRVFRWMLPQRRMS